MGGMMMDVGSEAHSTVLGVLGLVFEWGFVILWVGVITRHGPGSLGGWGLVDVSGFPQLYILKSRHKMLL